MTVARKPTQRAFDDWRTTCAARSGESSTARIEGGDVNRSTGATSAGGRVAGSRCSDPGSGPVGSLPGVSVIGLLGRWCRTSQRQMQPVGVRGGMMPG